MPHIVNWWGLRNLILEQFSETNRLTTLRDRFLSVRQTTTVAKYIAEFQAIVLELPEKAEADQVTSVMRAKRGIRNNSAPAVSRERIGKGWWRRWWW